MLKHQKYLYLLLVTITVCSNTAKAARPTWVQNQAEFVVYGGSRGDGSYGPIYTTPSYPCNETVENCVKTGFDTWKSLSKIEGKVVRHDVPNSSQFQILTYYDINFLYINRPGSFSYEYTIDIQYWDHTGNYTSANPRGEEPLSYTINNCSDPEFPIAVDGNADQIADICYKEVQSTEDKCAAPKDAKIADARNYQGDPISCSSGQSIQNDLIYSDEGPDSLSYTLKYLSQIQDDDLTIEPCSAMTSNFNQSIAKVFDQNGVVVYEVTYGLSSNCNPDDIGSSFSYIYYSVNGGAFATNAINGGSLSVNTDGSMTEVSKKGKVIQYDANGLVKSNTLKGNSKTYTYTSTGKIDTITNQYGKQLQFFYNENDLMSSLLAPDGQSYYFEYDHFNNMTKVILPDTSPENLDDNPSIQYVFENADFPKHMTGKINEKGIRYASWTFDEKGRATSSINGADLQKVEFDYSVKNQTRVTTHVSDTLSNDVIHHFQSIAGKRRLIQYEQLACDACEVGSWFYEYSANRLVRVTSPSGLITELEYEDGYYKRYLEKKKTQAKGTADEKITTKSWYADKLRLSTETTGNLRTRYSYYPDGNIMAVETRDINTNEYQAPYYTYSGSPSRLTQIDGPRSIFKGIRDYTDFTYDAMGNLNTITNALGHVTTLENYDANGRAGKVTDANGTVTILTYAPRGWLESSNINGTLTQYDYYPTGSVKNITAPNGQIINYEYDNAERLVSISDSQDNRMEYIRDSIGNVVTTNVKDNNNLLTLTQSSVFNGLSQLTKTLGNNGQENILSYDAEGNPVDNTNALNNTNTNSFDALNRVIKVVNPDNTETDFTYNSEDRVQSVTDAKGKTTQYDYNALGYLKKLTSPDTGITTFTYDGAGNVVTKTDARGITVSYSYDALNRLTTQSYADLDENISYTYDDTIDGNKGIGRLTSVSDQSGTTHYFYNAFGQITQQAQEIDGNSYLTEYHFDDYGQLTGLTYPGGRELDYVFDSLGRISSITTSYLGETQILASQISYLPFGPMAGLIYGNGNVLTQNYDLDYRLTDKSISGLAHTNYAYDLTNNITDINNALDTTDNKTYTYDVLSRLISGTSDLNTIDFSYDQIGNRLTKADNGLLDDYQYISNSHQLNSVVGPNAINQTFDAVGNTLTKNELTLTYNQQNRLHTASNPDMNALYVYNFRGERVSKSVNGEVRHFIFSHQGQLIAETDSLGGITKEYLYFNNQLIGISQTNKDNPEGNGPHTEIILDNPIATFSDNWPVSTSVTGYQGNHYQYHAASTASTLIVGNPIDNTDSGFSTTDNWTPSTSINGYLNSNYQYHARTAAVVGNPVDTSDNGVSITGNWPTSTSVQGYQGAHYRYHAAGTGSNIVSWPLTVSTTGNYDIYVNWTAHSNRASNAKYTLNHANGSDTITVNQKQNGGQWQLLGSYTLNAGSNHSISLSDDADGYVIADAVTLLPAGASTTDTAGQGEQANWALNAPSTASYDVYANWTAHANRASDAKYTIKHANGSDTVTVNQRQNGGTWNLLGTYTLDSTSSVHLSSIANGYVIADAVTILPAGTPPTGTPAGETATWQTNLSSTHDYEVYANWTAHANRASDAEYTIHHANGSNTVSVDQKQNGGQWNLLGTYTLDSSSTIALSSIADGYVIADAIRLVNISPTATDELFFVHNDHLGTPQVITDQHQAIVWQAQYDPFGKATVTTEVIVNNIRFPGQYFDRETGLHYNYFRYYDPGTGRYITSDPIGLSGGINTYGYAYQQPLRFIDPSGLNTYTIHVGFNVPFVGGIELGYLNTDGIGERNGLADVGIFVTTKKDLGGFALGKTTVGFSETLGCRENFDGTDAEFSFGFGDFGFSLGGFASSNSPTSASFEIGPQLGAEAQTTQTFSLTVGDLARGLANLIHGDGGRVLGVECSCIGK